MVGFIQRYRERRAAAAAAEAEALGDGMSRLKPAVRTYMYRNDATSCKRFLLLTLACVGSFIWWVGPLLGLLLVSPLINLMMIESSVITPIMDCFDHRLANQTCTESPIGMQYYFYNIKNADQWKSGQKPEYEEVGPFAFNMKEVRYNLQYNSDWTEVEYTYHQWLELDAAASCPTCTLATSITQVNRGYLQFLSAPSDSPLDPESLVIYSLMPITMSVIQGSIYNAIGAPSFSSPTLQLDTIKQWTDCSYLLPVVPFLGLTTPYLKDFPVPDGAEGFLFHVELCQYIPIAMQAAGFTITPADFVAYGVALDYTAVGVFLNLAVGGSNSTYVDPASVDFISGFMTFPKADFLAAVGAQSADAAAALSLLTDTHWSLLQGYIASLVPGWGNLVYSGWVQGGGGGLIVTKTVEEFLFGFDDPILLSAAQKSAAAAGVPEGYKLMPWTYRPFLGGNFASKTAPIDWFESVTGMPYNFSMLSWNSNDIGFYHPLIQHKRMQTGQGVGTKSFTLQQYRGVPFFSRRNAITNVTGINEGSFMGGHVDPEVQHTQFDSMYARSLNLTYTGIQAKTKKVSTLLYALTEESTGACNFTHYAEWAGETGFVPEDYTAAMAGISAAEFTALARNDTALIEYLNGSALGNPLSKYFNDFDVVRERCANPELFEGMWDISATVGCPAIFTFPRFLGAGAGLVETTGIDLESWAPNDLQHGYKLAVEPFSGYVVKGHKTYQANHLVSATANLYPSLWVSPGSAAATGLPYNFTTAPSHWLRTWWEPEDDAASLLRLMSNLEVGFYYALVAGFPVLGWLMLAPALFLLRFGKDGKTRDREMPAVVKSRARPLRLTPHEREMAEALRRIERGSEGVKLPESVPDGYSQMFEISVEGAEGDVEAGSAADTMAWQLKEKLLEQQQASSPRSGSPRISVRVDSGFPRAPPPTSYSPRAGSPTRMPSSLGSPRLPAGSPNPRPLTGSPRGSNPVNGSISRPVTSNAAVSRPITSNGGGPAAGRPPTSNGGRPLTSGMRVFTKTSGSPEGPLMRSTSNVGGSGTSTMPATDSPRGDGDRSTTSSEAVLLRSVGHPSSSDF